MLNCFTRVELAFLPKSLNVQSLKYFFKLWRQNYMFYKSEKMQEFLLKIEISGKRDSVKNAHRGMGENLLLP